MSEKTHFVYKVNPPRPTFAADQTETEAAIMSEHVKFWTGLMSEGKAVAFGPVLEPAGVWGLGIIESETEADVQEISKSDPVVTSGLATVEIYPMPGAIVRSYQHLAD